MLFWKWFEERYVVNDDPFFPDGRPADGVLVIGTGVSPDGQHPSAQSFANLERALGFFTAHEVQNVLLVGGAKANLAKSLTEARAMEDVAARLVARTALYVENHSDRTWLNAELTLPIVKRLGWTRVIIVAQQWHARRVRATFRKRWQGSGIEIRVVRAWSPYFDGSNCQHRFDRFCYFAFWDTVAFAYSWLKGYV